MDERDDILKNLAATVLTGDERAARELFRMTRHDVLRILAATVGDDPELDDMLQLAYLELFRSLGRFRGESRFTTWMYRLVVNVALQHLRHRSRRPLYQAREGLCEDWPSTAADPEVQAVQREQVQAVREVLAELSPKKRLVLVLHDVEGYEPAEIAEIVGINRFTVKSRLFHARRDFSRRLRQRAVIESGKGLARMEPESHDD